MILACAQKVATKRMIHLLWRSYRAIAKKYKKVKPADILNDLVASMPGREGKWYTAAKSVGLYDEAIELVNRTPCSHSTLIRAARDFCEKNPRFAMESGLAALKWLAAGYGYEVTVIDIVNVGTTP